MLWLHGGGFHVGASNDPMTYGEALAKKEDVVFVSVNHRLNILGFLDLSACGDIMVGDERQRIKTAAVGR